MAENWRGTIKICEAETLKSYQSKTILKSQHSRLYVEMGFQFIIISEKKIINKIAGKSYRWLTCVHAKKVPVGENYFRQGIYSEGIVRQQKSWNSCSKQLP